MAEWDERYVANWVAAKVIIAATYGVVALAIMLAIGGCK